MNQSIADIRKDYSLKSLDEKDILPNPFAQFTNWWNEAVTSNIDEVNAIQLATIKNNNQPCIRTVLLKDYNEHGFIFFTNYESAKGEQIAQNNNASILFFWKELQRQIRIEGSISKTSNQVSDAYFNSRPTGSKLGAWASPQSKVIDSREILETNETQYQQQFGDHITRPQHWGGYILQPNYFEFWQGRSNRLHDRIRYQLKNENWKIDRLAP